MAEAVVITIFPILMLIGLFGKKAIFRRQHIDIDGVPPLPANVFYLSKYMIVAVWGAMVAQSWGVPLSFVHVPAASRWAGCVLWAAGFAMLLLGMLRLGTSLRIGSPKEATSLQVGGLFRFSRNPMYVGVYATLLASALYTLNPIVLAAAVFVVAVHHRIVLAEERFLNGAFGAAYQDYCHRVRRYL